jgi:DNA-binding MarR family transcriptional regulator
MQNEIELLLGTEIDSLVKLELLLYLHERPGTAQPADELGARLRRDDAEVGAALEQLSAAGLIERFALGSGRHVVYGPSEDAHVQELLGLLHDEYHRGPEARLRLVERAARKDQRGPVPGGAES